jgi:hypothetical protein
MLIFIIKNRALWSVLSIIFLTISVNLFTSDGFIDQEKNFKFLSFLNIALITYGGVLLHFVQYNCSEYLDEAEKVYSEIKNSISQKEQTGLLVMFWCSLSALLGLLGWSLRYI